MKNSVEDAEAGTHGINHVLLLVLDATNVGEETCCSNPKRQTSPGYTPSNKTVLTKTMVMYIAMINDDFDFKEWELNIKMNKQRVTFKIDTGVQCNVISQKTNNKVSRQPLTQ